MLSWIIRRKINAFQAQYDYDMSYVRELLDVSPKAAMLYLRATSLGRINRGLPLDVFFVTKIAAVMHEDCGPCVQLGVKMAEQAGVAPATLRALLTGEIDRLPSECALAFRFARAVLTRDTEAEALREELQTKYGRLGVASLACALTSARIYPTMKYALGFGHACSRVNVAGTPVDTARLPSEPASAGVGAAA